MSQTNSPAARTIYSLAAFCNNYPNESQILEVRHRGAAHQETLMCFARDKIETTFVRGGNDLSELAQSIWAGSATWAEQAGAECFFVAQWLDAQKNPLATMQWRVGLAQDPANPMATFNGSVDSILAMQQTHIHSVMSLYLDGFKTIQNATKQIIEMQAARITELEASSRRGANVNLEADTELALETLANERTARLFEAGERVLLALVASKQGNSLEAAQQLMQAGKTAAQIMGNTSAGDRPPSPTEAPEAPSLPSAPSP